MQETQETREFDPWVEKIPWRRKWQPTSVFLLGKLHRQRRLADYNPWGHKESDMTDWLSKHACTVITIREDSALEVVWQLIHPETLRIYLYCVLHAKGYVLLCQTARRNINNLRYADDTTLRAESKEELKSLLMKVKEESEKAGLKLIIQKTKIKASGPITSCQIDREKMETVTDFILGGSKITADGDCRHVIKRHLLLGRKATTNLDSVLKSRDITLPTKVHIVSAMVFPVVMYGCESWAIKKAEHQRIDAFELWCWRRLLRLPWIARRSNKSILQEINTSMEGLRLKLQYFGHLFTGKDSDAWKDWGQEEKRGNRGWVDWMESSTQKTRIWANSGR